MRFDLAGLQLEMSGHSRVENQDWFVIDVTDATGRPVSLYPNQVHPHPQTPNRLTMGWVGEDADFRQLFWHLVLRRIAKAQLASSLGISLKQVTEAHIRSLAVRDSDRLLGRVEEPLNLRSYSLDDAVEQVTGQRPQRASRAPMGTVVNISLGGGSAGRRWRFTAPSTFEELNDSSITAGATAAGAIILRGGLRFPLTSIPLSAVINDSDLTVNVTNAGEGTPNAVDVYGYDTPSGDGDILNGDTAQTKFDKSGTGGSVGSKYVDNMDWSATGTETSDLGATADTDIQGNLTSPRTFSFGFRGTDEAPVANTYATIGWASVAQVLSLDISNMASRQPVNGGLVNRGLVNAGVVA